MHQVSYHKRYLLIDIACVVTTLISFGVHVWLSGVFWNDLHSSLYVAPVLGCISYWDYIVLLYSLFVPKLDVEHTLYAGAAIFLFGAFACTTHWWAISVIFLHAGIPVDKFVPVFLAGIIFAVRFIANLGSAMIAQGKLRH